jgi:hypothetical protein
MKYSSLFILFVLISVNAFSQSPESFKYQALIRSTSGSVVANKAVSIKITVLKGDINGEGVYRELHAVTTNAFGTVNLEIGHGTLIDGSFSTINWGDDTHFVKVEMDIDNDNVYEHLGTAQLLSVPYALYAQKSGDEKWNASGDDISYSLGKVGIGTESPLETLHVNGNIRGGQQGGAIRINSDFGYLDVGAKNPDYAHFYTDMPYGFYFSKPVTVVGQLIGYKTGDLHLSTQSNIDYQPIKRVSILNSNGYVGIGKTNPQYLLDVNGTINANSILINGQPMGSSVWSLSENNTYYNSGNVGIGTSTPLETLHVNGNIRGGQQGGAIRINTTYGYLDVGAKNADYAHFYTEMPYGFYFNKAVTVVGELIGYKTSDLHICTQSNSNYQPVRRISILNESGYIGIGTEQPKSQLQVESGDIYLNDSNSGVIMRSPNQQCWRLTVSDTGAPTFVAVTCPE